VRITGFQIDGFGVFSNCRVDRLSPGLNIFVGENEAGKSTLLAFLRQILLGLPTAGRKGERQYPPLRGGREGGILFLETDQGIHVRLERRKGPHGGRVTITSEDKAQGNLDLNAITGGMSIELYRNVFAFSLSELQSMESLNSSEVKSVIYSAGMGTGLHKLPEAEKFIAARQAELYKPRGRKMAINTLLSKLDLVNSELRKAEAENRMYDELCARLGELQAKVLGCREELDKKRMEKVRMETLQNLREAWADLNITKEKIAELGKIPEAFPEDGLIRIESLETKITEAARQLEENEHTLREKVNELQGMKPDAALIEMQEEVSGLMETLPLYRQAVDKLPETEAGARACKQEISTLCASLGDEWSVERIRGLDRSMFTRDAAVGFRQGLQEAGDSVKSLRQTCGEREEQLRQEENHLRAVMEEMEKLRKNSLHDSGRIEKPSEGKDSGCHHSGTLEHDYHQALSLHRNLVSMRARLEKLEQELASDISGISPEWTREELRRFDISAAAESWLREQEQEQRRINKELDLLKHRDGQEKLRLDQAKKAAASMRQELRELGSSLEAFPFFSATGARNDTPGPLVPEAPDTGQVLALAGELRSTVSRLNQLAELAKTLDTRVKISSEALEKHAGEDPSNSPPSRKPHAILFVFAAIFALSGPAAWYWLTRHPTEIFDPVFTALFTVVLALVFSGAGMVSRARKQKTLRDKRDQFLETHGKLEQDLHGIQTEARLNSEEMQALTERAKQILAALGIPGQKITEACASDPALEETVRELCNMAEQADHTAERMKALHVRLEEAEEKGKNCLNELEAINSMLGKYREKSTELEKAWQVYLAENRLRAETTPTDMNIIFGMIRSCRKELEEIERSTNEISRAEQELSEFFTHVEEISGITGLAESKASVSLENAGKFIENMKRHKQAVAVVDERVQAARHAVQKAKNAILSAGRQLDKAEAEFHNIQREWEEWLYANGFEKIFSPETLLEAMGIMERILEKQNSLEQLEADIQNFQEKIKRFRDHAKEILTYVARAMPDEEHLIPAVKQLQEEIRHNLTLQTARAEYNKEIKRLEKVNSRLDKRMELLRQERADLLYQAEAEDTEEFRQKHKAFMLHQSLLQQAGSMEDTMKRIAAGHNLEALLEQLETTGPEEIDAGLQGLEDTIQELQEEKESLSEKIGEIKDRLSRLADSTELSGLREKQEHIKAEIQELCRRWSVYAAAAHLITTARNYFEKERQPEVITRAGNFFRTITRGRYTGIISPPGTSELYAVTEDGDRIPPDSLSRGTAEQLYLALRFGYVTSRQGAERMPLLMDDILVNFDPARAEAAAETIISLADELQILFLTCHPETARIFRDVQNSMKSDYRQILFHELSEGNIAIAA